MGDFDHTFETENEFKAFVARNMQLTVTGPTVLASGPNGQVAQVIPTNVGNVVIVFDPTIPEPAAVEQEDLDWIEEGTEDIELTD